MDHRESGASTCSVLAPLIKNHLERTKVALNLTPWCKRNIPARITGVALFRTRRIDGMFIIWCSRRRRCGGASGCGGSGGFACLHGPEAFQAAWGMNFAPMRATWARVSGLVLGTTQLLTTGFAVEILGSVGLGEAGAMSSS
jgi:hypothetical protein